MRPLPGVDENEESLMVASQSVRAARGVLVLAMLGFVLGGLLVVLNSGWRNDFLAPGPLISSHARILGGLEGERCAVCHEAGSQPVAGWFASLVAGQESGAAADCQSGLCLKCHDRSLGETHSRFAHNVDSNLLEQLTRQTINASLQPGQVPARLASHSSGAELACSVCHREHRGADVSLSALTDAQCQACHVRQFNSLGDGHPDFALAVPDETSTIRFDHASHGLKHFAAANRTFDCQSCHPADAAGNVRLTANFDSACASCHADAIITSQRSGLELVAVPMLDLNALGANGTALQRWPEQARGGFDGRLPPLMRLLLAGDAELEPLLRELPDGFEFADLDPGSASDVATGGRFAAGLLRLLDELSNSGGEAVARRIAAATGMPADAAMKRLVREAGLGIETDVFRQWLGPWMPSGTAGGAGPSGQPANFEPIPEPAGSDAKPRSLRSSLGSDPLSCRFWDRPLALSDAAPLFHRAIQDEDLLAENPARQLIATGGTATGADRGAHEQPATDALAETSRPSDQMVQQAFPAGESSRAAVDDESKQDGRTTPSPAQHTGELLATNPLAGQLATDGGQPQAQPAHQLPNTGLAENLASRRPPRNASPPQAANQPEKLPAARPFSLSESSSAESAAPSATSAPSAWQADSRRLTLSRPPAGHADHQTQAWLEWLVRTPARQGESRHLTLFRSQFTAATSPGQCALCHQPRHDPVSDAVCWTDPHRDPVFRTFTRFDHHPHTIVADCESCHPLLRSDPAGWARVPTRLTSWPPRAESPSASFINASGLQPVSLANCTACHRPGGTPDACTTCHNYHIGDQSPEAVSHWPDTEEAARLWKP